MGGSYLHTVAPSTLTYLPRSGWTPETIASDNLEAQLKPRLKKKKKPFWKCCHPQKLVRFLIEDWLFLVLLGVTVACLSLLVDTSIDKLQKLRLTLIDYIMEANKEGLWQRFIMFLVWMFYTALLVVAAAVFSHYVAPQAFGSGVPELKTILRGVMLPEYLSFRTLLSKMVGLTLAIGSGLPVGKQGPFAHTGSIVANLLSRLGRNFEPIYENESRNIELLAAGCAVGVACTFSAPVGGVLFSIEVTSEYFAVRDYWRGFFAASCSSVLFALLRLYTHPSEVTVSAYFQTTFKQHSYLPEELLIFALLGFICGITGAFFIFLHRCLVLFLRRNSFMKIIFQRRWYVYPVFVSVIHAVIKYPKFIGQFLSGQTVFSHTLKDFFKNCTWNADFGSPYACNESLLSRWTGEDGTTSIFLELTFFLISFYFLTIVTMTLPIPAGVFMPAYVLGGAMGRLFGEVMSACFPNGFRNDSLILIYPGIYAVVGAASFCGAVTQTVSTAVVTFEMTGQLLHIVPVMIGVIIANVVCSTFQPSYFESLIKVKRLPYLPDIPKANSAIHRLCVQQFMVRNVKYITKQSTYSELEQLLVDSPELRAFPVVDNPESRILLGSINRENLLNLLDAQVGTEARRLEASRRAMLKAKQKDERRSTEKAIRKSSHSGKISSSASEDEHTEKLQKNSRGESNLGNTVEASQQKPKVSLAQRKHASTKIMTSGTTNKVRYAVGGVVRNIKQGLHKNGKKNKKIYELTGKERILWELEQLECQIDFTMTVIDPAPFQLVESTSLHKVHSLFSLLGVRRAYVTKCGVLIGVVALKELRLSIELSQSGDLDAILRKTKDDASCEDSKSLVQGIIGANIDQDSDETDDEDVILPRVEVQGNYNQMPNISKRIRVQEANSSSKTTYETFHYDTETSDAEHSSNDTTTHLNSDQNGDSEAERNSTQLANTLAPYLSENGSIAASGYHINIVNNQKTIP